MKSGKILTNEWIKKAIKRHENDLKKSESNDYPYYFNEQGEDTYPHSNKRYYENGRLIINERNEL